MSRLPEVQAKVDAFFSRVVERHGADMLCATGCSDCCHVRLTVTQVEADAIRGELAAWTAERRAQLAANAAAAPPDRCTALDPAGRCLIYAARPITCRSHGAPIRMRPDGARGLPIVQSCHRNFAHTTPDPDCVIDQETLSVLTLTVDRMAGHAGERVDLATLFDR